MKTASSFNRFNSNSRLLLGFLGVLLSACFLLAGLGATSKTFAARIGSPHPLPSTSSALSSKNDVASHPGPARRLDEQGSQPRGISFVPRHPRNTRPNRPAGNGDWSSLGPPGGDVFVDRASISSAGQRFCLPSSHASAQYPGH